MGDSSQNKIEETIQSLREVGNISYKRPPDKVSEYHSRLMETPEALLYLLRERKLNLKTIEHFQLGLSEKNRIAVPIFKNKELIDFKFRTLPPEPKGFSRCIGAETWIFNDEGLKEGRNKGEVLIVESETDCMSIWQAGLTNVISLVGGAMSTGVWLKDLLDIPKIYLVLDSDVVGQKAARNLADRIGIEKCINVKLPVKDANDFFKQYNTEDFKNVLRNSEKFPIQDVSPLRDLYDKVKESKSGEKDFLFYYQKLDELTKGFNKSNVIVVSAETSHGKSSWVLNVSANLGQHNIPVMYIPLEDNPTFLARRMFNILSGTEVSLLDETEWEVLKDKIRNFPFYLYMAQSKFNLKVFQDIVEKGKKIYNINIFVLDHLHFLSKGMENITEEIGYLMREVVNVARSQNVTVFLVSHIRKKIGEGAWTKMPDMNALRSSGLIKGDAHMVIMLFKHFENGKMIIDLAVQKNREGNITMAPITFEFDTETGIIKEHYEELKEAKNYEMED